MRVNLLYLIAGFVMGLLVSFFVWIASRAWPTPEERRKNMEEE